MEQTGLVHSKASLFARQKKSALILAVTAALSGCGDSTTGTIRFGGEPTASDLTLHTDHFRVKQGESYQFDVQKVVEQSVDSDWKLMSISDPGETGSVVIDTEKSFVFEARSKGASTLTYEVVNAEGVTYSSQLLAVVESADGNLGTGGGTDTGDNTGTGTGDNTGTGGGTDAGDNTGTDTGDNTGTGGGTDTGDNTGSGGGSDSGDVSVNHAPIAKSLSFEIVGGESISFDLLENVVDPDGDLVAITQIAKNNSKFLVDGSSVTYQSGYEESGVSTLAYVVEDVHGSYAVASVNISVSPVVVDAAVNTRPVAGSYSAVIDSSEESYEFDLLELGVISDKEGDALTLSRIVGANGRAEFYNNHIIRYTPGNFVGVNEFIYVVRDEHGLQSSGVFKLTVEDKDSGASAPVVELVQVSTHYNDVVSVDLKDFIIDADTPMSDIVVYGLDDATAPSVVARTDKLVTYAPNGRVGSDVLSFNVSDGLYSQTGRIEVTVLGDEPLDFSLSDLVASTPFETPVTIPVTLPSVDGVTYRLDSVSSGSRGHAVVNGNTVVYTPDAGVSGVDVLTYTVSDDRIPANSKSASISISIAAEEVGGAAPTVAPISLSTHYADPLVVDLSSYLADADTPVSDLVISGLTGASSPATASLSGQVVTYIPNGRLGTDQLTFTVTDGEYTAAGVIDVVVSGDAPLDFAISDLATSTAFETPVSVSVPMPTAGGVTYTLDSVTNGTLGSASISGNEITYTPNAGVSGTDTIQYTVSDDRLPSNLKTASITIDVNGVAPVVSGINLTTHYSDNVVIDLASYLSDGDTPVTDLVVSGLSGATSPSTASLSGQVITYVPNERLGADQLQFTVSDGEFSVAGTVNLTVEGDATLDFTLNDLIETTPFETAVTIPVTLPSADGVTYTLDSVTDGTLGTATISGNDITYTPNSGVSGTDTIQYTVSDDRLPVNSKSAAITIDVTGDVPVVSSINLTTHYSDDLVIDLSSYLSDGDTPVGDLVVADLTTATSPSTASLSGQVITYVPNERLGADQLQFTVSDGEYSVVGTVNLTVEGDATLDFTLSDLSETTSFETAVTIPVTLPSADGVTYTLDSVTDGTLGTATISGNDITYTPNSGVSGTDTIQYTVSDDRLPVHSKSASISIDIAGAVPVVDTINLSTDSETPISVDLADYVTDADTAVGDLVFSNIAGTTPPATVTTVGSTLTYTPNDWVGTDVLTFDVTDGEHTVQGSITMDVVAASMPVPDFNFTGINSFMGDRNITFEWDGDVESITFEVCRVVSVAVENPDGCEVIGSVFEQNELTLPISSLLEFAVSEYFIRATRDGASTLSGTLSPSPALTTSLIDYIKASNTGAGDNFGYALSLSGDANTLAVGAYQEDSGSMGINAGGYDDTATGSGAVYIFSRIDGMWWETDYLKAAFSEAGDNFGFSVSLSFDGNTLAIGAKGEDSASVGVNSDPNDNSAFSSGAAYTFVRDGGLWMQTAYIKPLVVHSSDGFGTAVELSGDGQTLVITAPGEDSSATGVNGDANDTSASGAGAAYVFKRIGNSFGQIAYLKASNAAGSNSFGSDVSISHDGQTVAIGAYGENSAATGVDGDQTNSGAFASGAAYVFARSVDNFEQIAYVKASNTKMGDDFGRKLALSGSGQVLAVAARVEGSPSTGINGSQTNDGDASGAVYLYSRVGNLWSMTDFFKASNAEYNDKYGSDLDLDYDGVTLLVGAMDEDSGLAGFSTAEEDNSVSGSGAAYLYRNRNGSWEKTHFVKSAFVNQLSDQFGSALSLSDDGRNFAAGLKNEDSASVGVGGDPSDTSASNAGAVYFY